MFSLPPEAKLDVLKCFTFDQLSSVKLTNSYFYNSINKLEEKLCYRMKFNQISILDIYTIAQRLKEYKVIKSVSEAIQYELTDWVKQKWRRAMCTYIRLYSHTGQTKEMLYPNEDFEDCNNGFPPKFAICLEKNVKGKPYHYLLILPDYPQDFKEMAIIRYWLKQLFNCAYEKALFDEVVLNPEIINLLFCDDRTTLRQFLIDKPEIFSRSSTFRKIWEYSLNYFKIYERLEFNFDSFDSEDFYILFKILLNEGKKLPKVCLKFNKSEKDWFREQVFDPLVDYITTSKDDFSKMVPFIVLDYYYPCGLQLTEKAENVEIEHRANLTSITYEIVNKHNPKVKFSFCSQGWKIGRKVYKTKIRIVKGIRRNLNYVESSDYKYFVN